MRLVLLGSRFVFVAVLEVLRQEVEINSRRAVRHENEPGGSVRGERANLTGLVLSCIEAKFCKLIKKRVAWDTWAWDTWGICTRRASKLSRARSQLYRSQNLQKICVGISYLFEKKIEKKDMGRDWKMKIWTNDRSEALAEIYTMHSFAPFSNLKFFVKNRQMLFAIELMNNH